MAYVAKTRQTDVDVQGFLDRAQPPARSQDGHVLCQIMQRISGEAPRMWGPSIVGFGVKAYGYASGHSGQMCAMGFSPRKPALVLYLADTADRQALLDRLGSYSHGKSCLYIKTLADVDLGVLEALVRSAWAAVTAPA